MSLLSRALRPAVRSAARRQGGSRCLATATNKFVSFDHTDAFMLNDQLTEEERMVRDSARAYCQEQLLPRVTEANRKELHDPNLLKEMGELGLLGSTIEGYGCAGLGCVRARCRAPRPSAVHPGAGPAAVWLAPRPSSPSPSLATDPHAATSRTA